MEVRFSHLSDPLGFLASVLRKEAEVLISIQDYPKSTIQNLYSDNTRTIDALLSEVIESWHFLREAALGCAGALAEDVRAADGFEESVMQAHRVAQKCLRVFDDLSVRYSLPQHEPVLFGKIGAVLYE